MTDQAEALAVAPTGLREKNRLAKRMRIREAARSVFCRVGYGAATTREIAARAEVATGTLFRYACDKRELLMMVVNDDLDDLFERVSGEIGGRRTRGDVCDEIVDFYRPRYEYFARYPELSRPFVRESFNFMAPGDLPVGPEANRNRARRANIVAAVQSIVLRHTASRQGRAASSKAARLIHSIYLSACREWLEAVEPEVETGLKEFSELLRLANIGLKSALRQR